MERKGSLYNNHDSEHHTLTLTLDYNSRESSPSRKSDELITIDMISDCVLDYDITYSVNHVEVEHNESYNWN